MTKWVTFDGRTVTMEKADQQHLSNIIWFHMVLFDKPAPTILHIMQLAKKQLYDRFDGKLLEYRPHSNFKGEIEMLQDKGYVVWNIITEEFIIVVNGERIGKIVPYEEECTKV